MGCLRVRCIFFWRGSLIPIGGLAMDEEDENEISDNFLSFVKDTGKQAKEMCRELKKLLNKKRKRLRRKYKNER